MENYNKFKEREPLYDEINGRRLKGKCVCPEYIKLHPDRFKMDIELGGLEIGTNEYD